MPPHTYASSSSVPMHPAMSSGSESSKTLISTSSSEPLFMGRRAGLSKKKRGVSDDDTGKLKRMSEMHIDVVFQVCLNVQDFGRSSHFFKVFGHLGPGDLLNMARTTKGLRGLLMDQSVQWLWDRSFSNIPELPPKPEDLTEPLYADLLFGRTCHVSRYWYLYLPLSLISICGCVSFARVWSRSKKNRSGDGIFEAAKNVS